MERPPCVLPAILHVLDLDHVEADGRLLGVDGEAAVQLLDARGEDVEEEGQLRLAADDDVPLQRKKLFSLSKSPSSSSLP
jgi:hypothetical protein